MMKTLVYLLLIAGAAVLDFLSFYHVLLMPRLWSWLIIVAILALTATLHRSTK
ncbi:MAG TPA: hypothetical protein VE986_08400 [Hyphomicrobiales bacterium]|nr:hypothetical protein [Hyphomicrobiales bacterium]